MRSERPGDDGYEQLAAVRLWLLGPTGEPGESVLVQFHNVGEWQARFTTHRLTPSGAPWPQPGTSEPVFDPLDDLPEPIYRFQVNVQHSSRELHDFYAVKAAPTNEFAARLWRPGPTADQWTMHTFPRLALTALAFGRPTVGQEFSVEAKTKINPDFHVDGHRYDLRATMTIEHDIPPH